MLTCCLVLAHSNQRDKAKRYKAKRYYLPNSVIKNHNFIIYGKNVFNQPIDSDIKRYEKRRKLTTRQGEVYTTVCSLGYEYIKTHYRLITLDLRRKKKLDAVPKAITEIEFVKKLQNESNKIFDNQSIFLFTILKKSKRRD